MLPGCGPAGKPATRLTVDFHQDQTMRYKFVSSRNIRVDWRSPNKGSDISKFSESMEMVVAYTPTKVDPYGLTTIKATCESVKVRRKPSKGARAGKDAVEHLPGKTFSFPVGPTGRIDDYSELDNLIHKIVGSKLAAGHKSPT